MVVPLFERVWAIVMPDPAEYPVTFGELATAVQAKVVPDTFEERPIEEVCPEHRVCAGGVKARSGVG
jgi:hypothetical protein